MAAQYKSMVHWIAEHVSQINTLEHDGKGERVEIIWWCSEDRESEVTTRVGESVADAFIKCVAAARNEQADYLAGRNRTLVQVFAAEERSKKQ